MYVYQTKGWGKYRVYKLTGAASLADEASLEVDFAPWYSDAKIDEEKATDAIAALQWLVDHISSGTICDNYKV
jgi:hypothetical protein